LRSSFHLFPLLSFFSFLLLTRLEMLHLEDHHLQVDFSNEVFAFFQPPLEVMAPLEFCDLEAEKLAEESALAN